MYRETKKSQLSTKYIGAGSTFGENSDKEFLIVSQGDKLVRSLNLLTFELSESIQVLDANWLSMDEMRELTRKASGTATLSDFSINPKGFKN